MRIALKRKQPAIKFPRSLDLNGIEQAIRRLPLKPELAAMSRAEVVAITTEIAFEVASAGYPVNRAMLECGSRQAIRELLTFEAKVQALLKHIKSLHRTSHRALITASAMSPIMLALELEGLLKVTKQAIQKVEAIPNKRKVKTPIKNNEKISSYLCKLYTRLTGRKPTRVIVGGRTGGPAYEFLSSIYKAFGLKLSAENQLRVYGV